MITLIAAAALAIGLAYLAVLLPGDTPIAAVWLMVVALATLLVALMALGARRRGDARRVVLPLAGTWLVLVVGFGLALLLPAETRAEPRLLLGLPLRTAIVLYGVGLIPLFAIPLAYGLTFREQTLSAEELDRLREEVRRLEAEAP